MGIPAAKIPASARWFRWAIALVWLWTGIAVLHPYYREVGLSYLRRTGLPDWVMVATCVLEVALALRVALGRATGAITGLQVGMIAAFTVILGVLDPILLADPFGALTKNVPLIAIVAAAWRLERSGWSRGVEWAVRGAVALVWVTEGLFPKILFQQAAEIAVVAPYEPLVGDPHRFLMWLGVGEIAAGLGVLLLRGRALALLLLAEAVALLALPLAVALVEPSLAVHPFAPLVKNAPILAATLVLAARAAPFLTARWSHLLLCSYAVEPERLAPYVPPGTELDVRDGKAHLSFVTLDFERARVFGIPIPGCTVFPGVNLRLYVRGPGGEPGVTFVRELVPLRVVAFVARALFREPFAHASVRSAVREEDTGGGGGGGRAIERTIGHGGRRHTVAATVETRPEAPGEPARFLLERHHGFGCAPGNVLRIVRIEREPWRVLPVRSHRLRIDWAALYGPQWAWLAGREPDSVAVAVGSPVRLWIHV